MQMRSFDDFWPFYVRQHAHPKTRMLHAIGAVLAVVMTGLAFAVNLWFLVAAPILGVAFAWFSHAYIEGNRPAMFRYPFFSVAADYRMLYLMMAGRMEEEVAKHRNAAATP